MTEGHLRELELRRLRAGEALGPDARRCEEHAATCAHCRARLQELDAEQARFEEAISFDRFAAGVERARRTPRRIEADRRWVRSPTGLASMAAALALVAGLGLWSTRGGDDRGGAFGPNRIKGGGDITVRVAGADQGPQRVAAEDAPEALSPGERLRIGYQAGAHRYVAAVSIDDQGEVTALYPEAGRSLKVEGGAGTRYLPDSLELTGRGLERLVIVLSDQPLEVQALRKAARVAFEKAKGDLRHLPTLAVPGEQFHRTFLKP